MLNARTEEMARDATVTVRLPDGTALPMRYSGHAANAPPTDAFWATRWTVPADTPPGVVRFTIEAVDGALAGRFQPCNVESSLLTIVPAASIAAQRLLLHAQQETASRDVSVQLEMRSGKVQALVQSIEQALYGPGAGPPGQEGRGR